MCLEFADNLGIWSLMESRNILLPLDIHTYHLVTSAAKMTLLL